MKRNLLCRNLHHSSLLLPSWAVIALLCFCVFVVTMFLIALIQALHRQYKRHKYDPKIKKKDNKIIIETPHKYSPVENFEYTFDDKDKNTGKVQITFKNKSKKVLNFNRKEKDYKKNLKRKDNIAAFIISDYENNVEYMNKYGACVGFDKNNPKASLDDFISLVKNESDKIDTIKIQINDMPRIENYKQILSEIGEKFGKDANNKINVVVNNMLDMPFEPTNLLKKGIEDVAKKYPGLECFYQENFFEDKFHYAREVSDDTNNISGYIHSPFKYYHVSNRGEFREISKMRKYNLLNANSKKKRTLQ